ncbi:MAG: Scr1 family TA system antitoxin-like transcriptional regulator [Pseudonocardiaceae bacterium]
MSGADTTCRAREAATGLKPHSPRWSRSKLQRVETRSCAPQPTEVEHLAAVYEVPADETAALVRMARETRQKGWWQSSALPKQFQIMVGLEQAATTVRQFELALMPGLLQTSDYARALMTTLLTLPDLAHDVVYVEGVHRAPSIWRSRTMCGAAPCTSLC